MSVLSYYRYALLASAAYIRAGTLTLGSNNFAPDFVELSQEEDRLPASIATDIFNPASPDRRYWDVSYYLGRDVIGYEDGSGFAATLFKDGTENVLAIRGVDFGIPFTQESDVYHDLFGAGVGGIGMIGVAVTQVIDLVNLIERLYGQPGQTVRQYKAEFSFAVPDAQTPYVALTADVPTPFGQFIPAPLYLTFSGFDKEGAGIGALEAGDKITVTGHSLGGHLAIVAAQLFPDRVLPDVYVFNSAGFDPVSIGVAELVGTARSYLGYLLQAVESLAKVALAEALGIEGMLLSERAAQQSANVIAALQSLLGTGAPVEALRVHSIVGEDSAPGNDISVVSSVFTGTLPVGEEILVGAEINSHSIEQLVDALAVQNVLHSLNGSLSLSSLKSVVDAANNKPGLSEEVLIEALHTLLIPDSGLADEGMQLLVSDASSGLDLWAGKGNIQAREALHKAILEIEQRLGDLEESAIQLEPIIFDPATMPTAAEVEAYKQVLQERAVSGDDAYAHRYSLKNLLPFVLTGVAYQDTHNQDGQLDLYEANSRTGWLTDRWLDDRALLLSVQLALYPQDKEVLSFSEDWQFIDVALRANHYTSTSSDEHGRPVRPFAPRKIIFGSDSSDEIHGSEKDDRIYGWGGADWIVGGRGDDYLEGGAGLDLYQYRGRREFSGELGYVDSNDGADTILDTDGRGVVRYAFENTLDGYSAVGVVADAFTRLSDTQWQSADGRFTYTFEGLDLRLTFNDPPGGTLLLKGYRNGDFGIQLGGARPTHEYQTFTHIIVGDLQPIDFDPETPGVQMQLDDLGNPIVGGPEGGRPDQLKGSQLADLIISLGGNDLVTGRSGDDQIFGGEGDDAIYGEQGFDRIAGDGGRDRLYGEDGADVVEGGSDGLGGGDILDGGDGNDDLYGYYITGTQEAIRPTGAAASPSGTRGDWLNGGTGDDRLFGYTGNDVLFGGTGTDLLVGGAGDDVLDGDNSYTASSLEWFTTGVSNPFDLHFEPIINHNIEPLSGASDVLYGGSGNDNLYGGFGDDVLHGESHDDVMAGADGNDTLSGGDGKDRMTGDSNALVFGDPGVVQQGDDYLDGGAGDDWLQGESGDDVLLGGGDHDELFGDATYLEVTAHGDDFLVGGEGDDKLYGQGGDDVLWGGPGNDVLNGGPGKDTYIFHKGDGTETVIDAEDGITTPAGERSILVLGEGIDREDIKFAPGSLVIHLGGGDSIYFGQFNPGNPAATPVLGEIRFAEGDVMTFEDILAQGFDIDGTEFDDDGIFHPGLGGTAVIDRIRGFAGNDIVGGGDGDDWLDGGIGDDLLTGDGGNDLLLGAEGDDILWGNAGNDELEGGAGADLLRGEAGSDIFRGGDGDDILWGDHDSTPEAEQGHDLLFGDAGDDSILGYGGNDYLDGGDGADLLEGREGNDILRGGAGSDVLRGGAWSDSYAYAIGDGADTIEDYDVAGSTVNVLRFEQGLTADTVLAKREYSDLIFSFSPGEGSVRVRHYFSSSIPGAGIGAVHFANGFVWNSQAILDRMTTGTDGADWLTGSDGGDTLRGYLGDDLLAGYRGNDTLEGGFGVDTYLLDWNNQTDTVIDNPLEHSRVRLGEGMRFEDLGMVRSGEDLHLSVLDLDSVLVIPHYYSDGGTWSVSTADGEERDLAAVLSDIATRGDVSTVGEAQEAFIGSARRRFLAQLSGTGATGSVTVTTRTVDKATIERHSLPVVQGTGPYTLPIESIAAGASNTLFDLRYSGVMMVDAGAGDDFIYAYGWGTEGIGSFLYGNAGNDVLVGTLDADVLHDGAGSNYLAGNDGNDTYLLLDSDSGTTIIDESVRLMVLQGGRFSFGGAPHSQDTVSFGAGIGPNDLQFSWSVLDVDDVATGNDHDVVYSTLEIGYGNGAVARIALPSAQDRSVGAGWWGVEKVAFVDGATLSFEEFLLLADPEPIVAENQDNLYQGSASSDLIYGYAGNDRLYGGEGADTLYGGAGFDLIDGGAGDDILYDSSVPNGGRYSGNNVFLGGAGNDVIRPREPSQGTVIPANLFAGGAGQDAIEIEWMFNNRWIISFNAGDGLDTLLNPYGQFYGEGTISLGGGITAADITAAVVNGDLFIGTGNGEGVLLQRWASPVHPFEDIKLQIVGANAISIYDLTAYALNGGSLSLNNYLLSTSSSRAIGGALAHRYAVGGEIDLLGHDTIVEVLSDAQFGVGPQRIAAALIGSALADELIGSELADQLYGRGGNDYLYGLAEDDLLNGESGNDFMFAGDGNDQLIGGEGNDNLSGDAGNDTLDGGAGSDSMAGGDGNDVYLFYRGAGADYMGEGPTDPASSTADRVLLVGLTPQDIQVSHTSFESLSGLGQESVYVSIAGTQDRFQTDAFLSFPGIEFFEFADGTVWDLQTLLANASVVPGTEFGEVLGGTAIADVITGLGGNDEVFANSGDDWVDAGEGDDFVESSRGNDILLGGAGADVLEEWFGANVLDGGPGDDYVYVEDSTALLAGGPGDDWIDAYGSDSIVVFNAGDGFDVLSAGAPLTLSLGGGLSEQDLSLAVSSGPFGPDIVLEVRDGAITMLRANQISSAMRVQIVDPAGVRIYDLVPALQELLAAHTADPDVTRIDLAPRLPAYRLSGSGREAYGGEVAYQYGLFAGLNRLDPDAVQGVLADENFGHLPQAFTPINRPPIVIDGIADQSASEDNPFHFILPQQAFRDEDPLDRLAYRAESLDESGWPLWLTFDTESAAFAGTPTNEDVGTVSIRVTATDTAGASVNDVFVLTVRNVNDRPVVQDDALSIVQEEGTAGLIPILLANDFDMDMGDELHIESVDASQTTGTVVFDPIGQGLFYFANALELRRLPQGAVAMDGFFYAVADAEGLRTVGNVSITVTGLNDAPSIANPLPDLEALEDIPFTRRFGADSFLDIDAGDTLTYTATLANGSELPGWLTFEKESRLFAGTPTNSDVGTWDIRVSAVDSFGVGIDDSFTLSVVNVNDTPVLNQLIVQQSAQDGIGFEMVIPEQTFLDIDASDVLTYRAELSGGSPLPSWLEFDPATRKFSGTPVPEAIGDSLIAVTATDRDGASAKDTFLLRVTAWPDQLLIGTAGADVLVGKSGDDVLEGLSGADQMMGGFGDDTYYVDRADDVVVELAGQGSDAIMTVVSYVLPSAVEKLALSGSGKIDAYGNELDNVLIGNVGNNSLFGGDGNDLLDGASGKDAMYGGAGDDTYIVDNPGDKLEENAGEGTDTVQTHVEHALHTNFENLLLVGDDSIDGTGNDEANYMAGNHADNALVGEAGNDILQGAAGNDEVRSGPGRGILDGGAGDDVLAGFRDRELLIGGGGNDRLTIAAGADIIAFNRGDGQDVVGPSSEADNTLSLGGGIRYEDLRFRRSGNDLVLQAGNDENLAFRNWYSGGGNRSVLTLQVIAEAMADFDAGSSDPLLNRKVQTFDFSELVAAFDAAGQVDNWALTNALLDAHLASSDTDAIGGDVAYRYGLQGSLAGIGVAAAFDVINAPLFGSAPQTLRPLEQLQQGQIRLV